MRGMKIADISQHVKPTCICQLGHSDSIMTSQHMESRSLVCLSVFVCVSMCPCVSLCVSMFVFVFVSVLSSCLVLNEPKLIIQFYSSLSVL